MTIASQEKVCITGGRRGEGAAQVRGLHLEMVPTGNDLDPGWLHQGRRIMSGGCQNLVLSLA
jgi:hypothetical protein